MLLKQKRFVNSKLNKIVELYQKEKDNKLTVAEESTLKIIKTKAKLSAGKFIEKRLNKKYDKAYKKYEDRFSELDKMFDNDEISQEQYDKKITKAEYKLDKVEYALDMEGTEEKPKNPMWKNIKETISKGLTSTRNFFVRAGQGIKGMFRKVPLMLETGAKETFKLGYKAGKHTIKGAKTLGNKGAKTLGKGVKFVGTKISEATKDIREEADREMEEKASAKQEKAMFDKIARQQVDAIKDKNPRESLGMQHFEINHEEAIKKSEEKSGEEKEPEQLENN